MSSIDKSATRWLNKKITEAKKKYIVASVFTLFSATSFVFFCWYLSVFASTWLIDGVVSSKFLFYSLFFLTGRYTLAYFASLQNYYAGNLIVSRIKKRLYPILLTDNRLDSTSAALYLTKISDDLKPYFTFFIPYAIASAVVSLSLLAVCFYVEKWVGLILLISVLVIPMQMIVIGTGAETLHKRHIDLFLKYSAVFYNRLQTITEIVNLNNFKKQYNFLKVKSDALNKATSSVMRVAFLSSAVLELFVTLSIAAVAIYLGMSLLGIMPGPSYGKGYSFRNALFLLTLAPYFFFYLRKFVSAYHDRNRALASAKIVMPLLESEDLQPLPSSMNEVLDSFEIRNLSFSYPNSPLKVLHHINFSLPTKGLVLIKGISGSGKSTLLKICSGNLSVEDGMVNINQQDSINSRYWLMENSAYMNQFPFIFNETLKYNVFLEKEHITNVEYPAFLEPILSKKEEGWETILNENGRELSGGEKQLITLARLMLHPKSIVILDEPTASLDPETIAIILPQIIDLAKEKLVIIASHEKKFDVVADKILYLNWGEQEELPNSM